MKEIDWSKLGFHYTEPDYIVRAAYHDGAWEEIVNSFRYRDLTRPFGVVPSDTELSWEVRRENDGYTEHEYLTCTGILWSGRYPECEKIIRD